MLTTLRSNWQETMKMKQTSHRFAPIVTDMKQKKMNWNLKPLDQIVCAADLLQFAFCRKSCTVIWMTSENPRTHEMKSPNVTNSCIWEDDTKHTFEKKKKLSSKAKLVFWHKVAKSPLKRCQHSNLTFKQQNIPGKGKHHQKKPFAFCNTAALMSALFIVGQLIQSSTSEETRLAAAAILLQCQNTKNFFFAAQGAERSQSLCLVSFLHWNLGTTWNCDTQPENMGFWSTEISKIALWSSVQFAQRMHPSDQTEQVLN